MKNMMMTRKIQKSRMSDFLRGEVEASTEYQKINMGLLVIMAW